MTYFLLEYLLADDYLERRAPLRTAHIKLAGEAQQRGELLIGGALSAPTDRALLLFLGDSPQVAERFAHSDPYVRAGLVKSWTVRPWNIVVGAGLAALPPLQVVN